MENKIFRMPGPKVINKLVEDGHLPGELRHDPKAVEQAVQRARQALAAFLSCDDERWPSPPAA